MTTKPTPEIKPADLQAALHFLTADRDDRAPTRAARPRAATAPAIVHLGIARARSRAAGRRDG